MLLLLLLLSLLASAQALSEEKGSSPTVLQYVLEAVVGLPEWSQYLPDDIDVDQDGNLNEKEVEIKFKSYAKNVFDQLDRNADKLVTQEEFRNASINLIGINKIIDIAMQAFPIKTILRFGDRNQDGFISEDDFLIPENNRKKLLHEYYKETFGNEKYYKSWNIIREQRESGTNWTIGVENVPGFKESSWSNPLLMCSKNFGLKEAEVLCREMGNPGVHSVSSIRTYDYLRILGQNDVSVYGEKFECQGTESSLEECQKFKDNDIRRGKCPHDNIGWNNKELLASVHCALSKDIGKVELAGGKDDSSGDLHIGLEKYCEDISPEMAKVVCTELGFITGTPLVTRNNFFTDVMGPPNIERRFECNGTEQTLQDCQAVQSIKNLDRHSKYRKDPINSRRRVPVHCIGKSNGIICRPGEPLWEKYGKPPGEWSEDPADYNDGERGFYHVWEKFGRYLLIADTNEDHKASMEELSTKLKEIVASVFHVMDQTHDGVFSISDLMTLNVRQSDFLSLVRKLFQILSKGDQQIDLYTLNVPGLDGPLGNYDHNHDKIINLKDFSRYIDSSRMEGLATILVKQVDPNQDGMITATELDNYVKAIFNHLGGGTVTLESIWKLMRESQFTCLQIHGIQTFVEALKDTIDSQTKKLLDYFFGELDLNDNGEIALEDLLNAHVPCDEVNPYKNPFGILAYKNPAERIGCNRLLDGYSHMSPQTPSLSPPDQGPLGGFVEKFANAACIAMQPDF